ncbi:hypothetical protein HanXRQr2_Chr09g0388911 [Helianthus annuus]|uniref:Uncharacterized protein n=1 Tax=Helianthus annuus TaxID=4232 RepID=A0A9K3I6R6_HELAN|nr:hypothetical protein HanXRQr2_Chr09g0388911 [Helianthus annuus]
MCDGHGDSTNQNLKSGTPVIDLNNFDNDSSTSGDRFSQKTRSTPYSSHNNHGRQRVRVRTAQRLGFHGINKLRRW